MVLTRLRNQLTQELPLYASGSSKGPRRLATFLWLKASPDARAQLAVLRHVNVAVRRQRLVPPPPRALDHITSAIETIEPQEEHFGSSRPSLVPLQLVLAVLALLLIFFALAPGIKLEWTVRGQAPSLFRIYRAPVSDEAVATLDQPDEERFVLLEEVPVAEEANNYVFTDRRSLPGKSYLYRVEAIDQSGQLATSQTILGRGLDALAAQLSAIVVLVATLLIAFLFISKFKAHESHTQIIRVW